jgi:4-hydroxybenzoate polyprenyltransferase
MTTLSPTPPAPTAAPPRARGVAAIARTVAGDIKLAHSVFAMPFAILGGVLAWHGDWAYDHLWSPAAGLSIQLALIVLCMVAARTWAMLFNRIADRRFDADNPRTARRALASGRLSLAQAWAAALLAAGAFIAGASLFYFLFDNPWPARLSIPVLAWIAFYSLTKRFTWLCHLFLGGALAASPIAAAIAVNPSTVLPPWPMPAVPAIYLLAAMVLFWVAGFDVIYAMQDIDFDRARGLSSIPARLGWRGAAWTARALHLLAFLMLVGAWLAHGQFGPIFLAAVALVGGLLVFEHIVLYRRGKAGLDMAFFTVNGIVSCLLGIAGCLDVVIN